MVLYCHLKPEVIKTVRKLILEDEKLQEYMQIFDKEVSRGLDIETCEEAQVKSIITHVNKLPTGKEEGQFLGLDFSDTIIKVMLVKLDNRECTITRKMYDVPQKYMVGKSEKVFDFVAKSIVDFLKGIKLKILRIPLGVTFGFPIEQTTLQNCILLKWEKGFQCNDLVGQNVCTKLKDSIRKFPELKRIYVIGILNEAVSAVLACAWQDPTCLMAAVIGPGASCCYAEKAYRVTKYETDSFGIRDIYMNIESSCLGDDGCLEPYLTEFDSLLHEGSRDPGRQTNEKLISTVYFGELVRLILLRLLEDGYILDGVTSTILTKKNSITLEHLQRIESDPDTSHDNCRQVLNELGYGEVTDEDCFQVQFVSRCVSRRSANLVAAQLVSIINRINLPSVTIAAEGDLIKNYPNYKWYLTRKMKQLKNPECDFKMTESGESGLGPAVMAAVFGKEVMDREEKLRRLPGFPMDKCHFGKTGKCLNPDCNMRHPCDTSRVNPLQRPITADVQEFSVSKCMERQEDCNIHGKVTVTAFPVNWLKIRWVKLEKSKPFAAHFKYYYYKENLPNRLTPPAT